MNLQINTEELTKQIDRSFKEMRLHKFVEEDRFAIFECNGIQVQVVLTKDESEKLDAVVKNIVSVNS